MGNSCFNSNKCLITHNYYLNEIKVAEKKDYYECYNCRKVISKPFQWKDLDECKCKHHYELESVAEMYPAIYRYICNKCKDKINMSGTVAECKF